MGAFRVDTYFHFLCSGLSAFSDFPDLLKNSCPNSSELTRTEKYWETFIKIINELGRTHQTIGPFASTDFNWIGKGRNYSKAGVCEM